LPQYAGVMDGANEAWVYYSPDAVAHKKLPPLSKEDVANAFGPGVRVFDDAEALGVALSNADGNKAMALMSSGNFSGLDLKSLVSNY